MATKTAAKQTESSEIGQWLVKNGFVRMDSYTSKLGEVYVIKPRPEQPWWTVQKRNGSSVRWFVDFPAGCPWSAVCRFIESV